MSDRYDVIVIGAGIAGASVAAQLSETASVCVLERESQPGYHSTGRSAAMYIPSYGPAPIRALTRASAAFFYNPPAGFSDNALLSKRGVLVVAAEPDLPLLENEITAVSATGGNIQRLDGAETRRRFPLLREEAVAAAYLDADSDDIDVGALHQGYLRQLRARGGDLRTDAEVVALNHDGTDWKVETTKGTLSAPIVVNAAGAWCDIIGAMAGAEPIGLTPKRRTVMIVAAPEGYETDDWPMVCDVHENYFMKPDAGRLLISPANTDPDVPSDVQPDEMDVAIGIDRVERAFDMSVRRIENKWAGLRSFVADGCPVAGYSTSAPGFFWLAGQGGYGIQTAPALSRLAASIVLGKPAPEDVLAEGLDPADLSPARLTVTAD